MECSDGGDGRNDHERQATSLICPKGWRLPTSTSSGELKRLLDVYSVGADVAKLASSPLYFVRGGYISQNAGFLFDAGGSEGDYWSSTPYSNASSAYFINFDGTLLLMRLVIIIDSMGSLCGVLLDDVLLCI